MVTLRGDRMYDFLDRLVSIALPRVRDFRGVSPRGFDGRGNYTLGLRDQLIFTEIDYLKVDKARGMNVCVVTTAKTDEEARKLLQLMGMPFRHELDEDRAMATTAKMAREKKTLKFKVRHRNRCQRCGRPRAYLRKFALCRLVFPRARPDRRRRGRDEEQLVRLAGLGTRVPGTQGRLTRAREHD